MNAPLGGEEGGGVDGGDGRYNLLGTTTFDPAATLAGHECRMAAPSLQHSALNLLSVKQLGERDFITALQMLRGKKALVLDATLSGPLGLITEKQTLRENGVEKTFHLLPEPLQTDQTQIIFVVRADIRHMKTIAQHIHAFDRAGQRKEFCIAMVPRRTIICERVLEEEGVLGGNVMLTDLAMDLFAFEDDVLSMEMPSCFRECAVDNDRTSLYYVARAIMKLQCAFGIVKTIKGKGAWSRSVADILLRMRREMGAEEPDAAPEIAELILIDRSCDLVTPMLTQLTYEGLVDENFGISNSIVELDPAVVAVPSTDAAAAGKKVKVALNSNDKVFADLRDLNFSVVGSALKKRALALQQIEQEKGKLQSQGISEIKDYVKKLKEINVQQEKNLLSLHTNLASSIGGIVRSSLFNRNLEVQQSFLHGRDSKASDFIEELIYKQEPVVSALRLMCLSSAINGGLKKLDFFKRELVQSYGIDALLAVSNLEKAGLLRKDAKAWWPPLKKALALVKEDVDESRMDDLSYVYSGYAPVSARIAHQLLRRDYNLRAADELLRPIPGPLFEEAQAIPAAASARAGAAAEKPKVAVIFFIGGITFSEISALRWLAKAESRDIVICTTKLISGPTFLESLIDKTAL